MIKIINKKTKEELETFLQNNYYYRSANGIITCDFYKFNYKPGVVDNKPVVIRQQFYPKWFSGRFTIDSLDASEWEINYVAQ